LYSALKKARNSTASVVNIDPQEKIYRKQTNLFLDLAKPLLLMSSRATNKKKSRSDHTALKSALMLWFPFFCNITQARRFNILSQVHPDHTGLLSRAAEKLPIGSENLLGDKFMRELLSQVKVASRVSTSVSTTQASASTPIKHSKNRKPASTPATPATGSSHRYDNWYVQPSIFPLTILPDVTVHAAGCTSLFVETWAQLTKD
jgi:hypothetical protein